MTKLPSDDELRDAFWTGYAAASWGEKEVSGMRACAALAIARMNERATPSALHEAARMAMLYAIDVLSNAEIALPPVDARDGETVTHEHIDRAIDALRAAIGEQPCA